MERLARCAGRRRRGGAGRRRRAWRGVGEEEHFGWSARRDGEAQRVRAEEQQRELAELAHVALHAPRALDLPLPPPRSWRLSRSRRPRRWRLGARGWERCSGPLRGAKGSKGDNQMGSKGGNLAAALLESEVEHGRAVRDVPRELRARPGRCLLLQTRLHPDLRRRRPHTRSPAGAAGGAHGAARAGPGGSRGSRRVRRSAPRSPHLAPARAPPAAAPRPAPEPGTAAAFSGQRRRAAVGRAGPARGAGGSRPACWRAP